ncbi:unnamed protein product, partial [Hapterophycus canaliculatus]
MARNVRRDIRNEIDWINSILFPGGLGDDRAVLLLAKVLCIANFALVKPFVANGGDRVLWTTDSNSAPLHGKKMVMIHNGHFEAIAPKHDEPDTADVGDLGWVVDGLLELCMTSLVDIRRSAGEGGNMDAGPGAGVDASPEAGVDASGETGAEAGGETGVDTSGEAGGETGVDTSGEAGWETGVDTSGEAGGETGAEAGGEASGETGAEA